MSAPRHHWFEGLADHMGSAYLRYSFTRGTEQEADALVAALQLMPGDRVLDLGCGPGRHVAALARRGITVVGLDIAAAFLRVAADQLCDVDEGCASLVRGDARALPFTSGFDAAISLCQGGFGLLGAGEGTTAPAAGAPDPDGAVLDQLAGVLRPGGRLALSAFSAYFQVRWLEDSDAFDAAAGVNHERTTIRSPDGEDVETDLWTSCFTPRELRLLAARAGLEVEHLWGVTPGRYQPGAPSLEHPELLLIAHR